MTDLGSIIGRIWREAKRVAPSFLLLAETAAAIVLLFTGINWVRGRFVDHSELRVLNADLSMAVTGFLVAEENDNVGASTVEDLTLSFWGVLETELTDRASRPVPESAPLTVDVMAPAESKGPSFGNTSNLESDLSRISATHNAGIVATALVSSDLRTVQPVLFVSETALPNAPELAGLHYLGPGTTVRSSIAENSAARAEIREALTTTVASIAEFTIALGRLENGNPAAAIVHLETALELWPATQGKAVLYLFLANSYIHLSDYAAAREAILLGLGSEEDHTPRLDLALLEVEFHGARGGCTSQDTATSSLVDIHADYQSLASRPAVFGSASFASRVQFGIARSRLCLASIGVDFQFWQAAAPYLSVIESYEAHSDSAIQDMAAESFAGLAIIADRSGVSWDTTTCSSPSDCYSKAAELAVDQDRRDAFLGLAASS